MLMWTMAFAPITIHNHMNRRNQKIQRVELLGQETALHCPFCGAKAYSPDPDETQSLKPCEHALFVAHDEGFEYRSPRFDRIMNLAGVADDDIDPGAKGYDALTDGVICPDAVKFACYVPAPSFFGSYHGFAPTEAG